MLEDLAWPSEPASKIQSRMVVSRLLLTFQCKAGGRSANGCWELRATLAESQRLRVMEESRAPKITSLLLSYFHRGNKMEYSILGKVGVCVCFMFFSLGEGGGGGG